MNSAAEEPRPPVFDVASAIERVGDDLDLLREVCRLFVDNWPAMSAKIETALADEDLETVRSVAHQVKGSAGNLSAERVFSLAAELEKACAFGEREHAVALTQHLEAAVREFESAVSVLDSKEPEAS